MKIIQTSFLSLTVLLSFVTFFNCSSVKQNNAENNNSYKYLIQENPPIEITESYYQHWVADVKGGASGIYLHIYVKDNTNNVLLESVYFRGMHAKLETIKPGYVANFITEANYTNDIIMSSEPESEYANQIPSKDEFPFKLKDNECVVGYNQRNTIKYFKIKNLFKKPMEIYPATQPGQ
ncbi:hypothetical protein [Oceanihabitans sediminis]|uniref:Lipoprotein n=1 Tax=Oceanihabitans sediminis TaxID=1812012 RepID=A0A368P7A5_9FLAO|nr:hypothetical protein [Oceanihabitans sediminis]MDX1278820.1 hypothetical protein [Oceanihabitans sediminis]RBP34637.1 hypothetical protein DFR65_101534 [Oceanihabitans sediminis]RCU58293.1 hypothetical protein DU428_02650 [Oceanihabitans sediminis]